MDNLLDLVKEIEYQDLYSYEKRVDLFNKYHISTSTKYINPIMLLSEHIRRNGTPFYQFDSFHFQGVSHSGAVQTAFNKEITEGKNRYVEIREMGKMTIVKIYNSIYMNGKREMKQILLFKEIKETGKVSFKLINAYDFFPKRGFCYYEWAEEFCKDFNFKINFI